MRSPVIGFAVLAVSSCVPAGMYLSAAPLLLSLLSRCSVHILVHFNYSLISVSLLCTCAIAYELAEILAGTLMEWEGAQTPGKCLVALLPPLAIFPSFCIKVWIPQIIGIVTVQWGKYFP